MYNVSNLIAKYYFWVIFHFCEMFGLDFVPCCMTVNYSFYRKTTNCYFQPQRHHKSSLILRWIYIIFINLRIICPSFRHLLYTLLLHPVSWPFFGISEVMIISVIKWWPFIGTKQCHPRTMSVLKGIEWNVSHYRKYYQSLR